MPIVGVRIPGNRSLDKIFQQPSELKNVKIMFVRWTLRNIPKERRQQELRQHRFNQHHVICMRCGFDLYSEKHQWRCPALDAKCFKCEKKGHFRRQCRSPIKPKSNGPTASRPRVRRKYSARKMERNKQRMTEYNNRKQLHMEFPFAEISDNEILKESVAQVNLVHHQQVCDFKNTIITQKLAIAELQTEMERKKRIFLQHISYLRRKN